MFESSYFWIAILELTDRVLKLQLLIGYLLVYFVTLDFTSPSVSLKLHRPEKCQLILVTSLTLHRHFVVCITSSSTFFLIVNISYLMGNLLSITFRFVNREDGCERLQSSRSWRHRLGLQSAHPISTPVGRHEAFLRRVGRFLLALHADVFGIGLT